MGCNISTVNPPLQEEKTEDKNEDQNKDTSIKSDNNSSSFEFQDVPVFDERVESSKLEEKDRSKDAESTNVSLLSKYK